MPDSPTPNKCKIRKLKIFKFIGIRLVKVDCLWLICWVFFVKKMFLCLEDCNSHLVAFVVPFFFWTSNRPIRFKCSVSSVTHYKNDQFIKTWSIFLLFPSFFSMILAISGRIAIANSALILFLLANLFRDVKSFAWNDKWFDLAVLYTV